LSKVKSIKANFTLLDLLDPSAVQAHGKSVMAPSAAFSGPDTDTHLNHPKVSRLS
jgi:hypothetical protein